MYVYPTWTSKNNLSYDTITNNFIKTYGVLNWNARAFYKDAFDFSLSPSQGKGMKIFHNTNEAEETNYAIGITQTEVVNIFTPEQLDYCLHFHYNDNNENILDVLDHGTVIHTEFAENIPYYIEFDETETKLIVYKELTLFDGSKLEETIFEFPNIIDLNFSYHAFLLVHTSQNTDIDIALDFDGIKCHEINDVTYELLSGEITETVSVFRDYDGIPTGDVTLTINTVWPIEFSTLTQDSIKLYRFVPNSEDVNVDKELVSIILPSEATTAGSFEITALGLQQGYTYELVLGTSDCGLIALNGIPFKPRFCIFKTEGELPELEDEALNQYFNDVYFKARNLSKLIDVDSIIHEVAGLFDFQYKVTEYDPETDNYHFVDDPVKVDAGVEDTDQVLNFNTSQIIEELFVQQYLPEYAKYMTDINDDEITIIASTDREKLKELLFKNITLMNYFKGSRTQMEFLISIFSSSIGYYYVSVDPDPYRNFVYRISTSLPEKYWIDDIKDITHPLGWDNLYIYVPRDATNWHQMVILDEETFEKYWELHSKQISHSYIDFADYLDNGEIIRHGNFTANAMYDDFFNEMEKAFPFHETTYSAKVDYNVTSKVTDTEGLFYDIRSTYPEVIFGGSISQELSGDRSYFKVTSYNAHVFDIEFLKSGIASEYIWKVIRSGGVHEVITTRIPKLKLFMSNDEAFEVQLTLKFRDQMEMSIFNYRLSNQHIKLQEGYVKHLTDEKYIDKLVNNYNTTFNGVILGDLESEKLFRHHEAHYSGVLDFVSINNIIGNIQLNSLSGNEFELFFNDESSTENFISGLFLQYEWTFVIGTQQLTLTTNEPYIKAPLTPDSISTVLVRGDEAFLGPTYVA